MLSAASDEEKKEMDRRARLKEEGSEVSESERPAQGAFERALQAAKDALLISRPTEDEQLLLRALLSLATAHMMCLESEDANECIDEGLPLAERLGCLRCDYEL